MVHLTVCSYHVTYAFQSESTLYSCLSVKELLARNRREIWSLSDCNGTRTHNHLIRKRTLNHLVKLAKWLSCVVSTYLYGAFDCMFLSCHVCVSEWIHTLYSQMHRTDKYSQHSSIIWPIWLNGWVFVYELNGCGFESRCSHLNFRFRACFEQGVPWHSGNYRVWIHSETRTWHDKNIQSNAIMFKLIIKVILSVLVFGSGVPLIAIHGFKLTEGIMIFSKVMNCVLKCFKWEIGIMSF